MDSGKLISAYVTKFFKDTLLRKATTANAAFKHAERITKPKVSKKSNLQRLADVNAFLMNMNGEKCLDVSYANTVKALRNEAFTKGEGAGGRQWIYQTCTEFGW